MMPQPNLTVPPNLCWPAGGEIDIMEVDCAYLHQSLELIYGN